jgi:HAD superfamily hydrolase (TIGR01549 family)
MIKAALIDIGNVLLTFDHLRAANSILPRSKKDGEAMRHAIMSRLPQLETGRMTSEEFLAEVGAELEFDGRHEELEQAFVNIFQPNEPMWELLTKIGEKIPLCLFSNISQLHEEFILSRYPQFDLFPLHIMSWRVGHMKPQREIYDHALEKLGVKAQEILYIDDLEHNIRKGSEFGMQAFQYDYQDHEALLRFLEKFPEIG